MSDTILLIGAGFIGSKLVPYLKTKGEVVVLDTFITSEREWLPDDVTVVTGSAMSHNVIDTVFDRYRPDYVLLYHNHSIDKQGNYDFVMERKALANSVTVISEALKKYKIKHLCIASSIEVYKPKKVAKPLTEVSPTAPETISGELFYSSERFLYKLAKQRGFKISSLRYSVVYGDRKFVNPKEDPISFSIKHLKNKVPLVICRPYEVFDIIHIDDAVSATELFFDKCMFLSPEKFFIYNIGSSEFYSNLELSQKLFNKFDLKVSSFMVDDQSKCYYIYDITSLKKLGWLPTISFDSFLSQVQVSP